MNDRLRLLDHGGARYDTHPADQRVDADQCRDLRLIVHQRVGVELRCLIDELLVQLLPSGLFPRQPLGAILMVLRMREPNALKIEATCTPVAPAPTTSIDGGTEVKAHAS